MESDDDDDDDDISEDLELLASFLLSLHAFY